MNRGLVAFVALVAFAATACERTVAHTVSAPLDEVRDATLEVATGADAITVRSEDLGDDLYVISAPVGVEREDGLIRVGDDDVGADDVGGDDGDADGDDGHDGDADADVDLRRPPWDDENPNDRWSEGREGDRDTEADDRDGPGTIEIRLNTRVRWTLRLAGGADAVTIDMSAGGLAGVEFVAGVTHIRLALPTPDGTIAVRMLAGASEFDLTAPPGVPARVRLGSGAGSVTVDGSTRTGVAQGTVLAPSSWESASDRYDIDASAGVSRLTLARH